MSDECKWKEMGITKSQHAFLYRSQKKHCTYKKFSRTCHAFSIIFFRGQLMKKENPLSKINTWKRVLHVSKWTIPRNCGIENCTNFILSKFRELRLNDVKACDSHFCLLSLPIVIITSSSSSSLPISSSKQSVRSCYIHWFQSIK